MLQNRIDRDDSNEDIMAIIKPCFKYQPHDIPSLAPYSADSKFAKKDDVVHALKEKNYDYTFDLMLSLKIFHAKLILNAGIDDDVFKISEQIEDSEEYLYWCEN